MGLEFWHHKDLDQLREEQDVPRRDVSQLVGAGASLWNDDEEFEAYEEWLWAKRRRDRRAAQRALDEALKTPA